MLLFLLLSLEDEERDKFEEIYNKFSDTLLKFAMSRTDNQIDAAELVEEVFFRVIRNKRILEITKDNEIKTFLIHCAKNVLADSFKKKSKMEQKMPSMDGFPSKDVSSGNEDEKKIEYLIGCLSELPEEGRVILQMKYDFMYSNEKIAKILNKTVYSVKKSLKESIETLRKDMETYK